MQTCPRGPAKSVLPVRPPSSVLPLRWPPMGNTQLEPLYGTFVLGVCENGDARQAQNTEAEEQARWGWMPLPTLGDAMCILAVGGASSRAAARTFPTMGHYRFYELDPSGHIMAGYSVECGSDADAMRVARTLLERAAVVEVWKSNHCVAHLSVEARQLWPEFDSWRAVHTMPHLSFTDFQGVPCLI